MPSDNLRQSRDRKRREALPKMELPKLNLLIQILIKNQAMLDKFKSRKLWAAVIGAAIVALGDQLGLAPDTVQWIGTIITGYVVGQGIADAGAQGVK